MVWPPDPKFPTSLLIAAAKFGYVTKGHRANGEEVGVFVDGTVELPLFLVAHDPNARSVVAWDLIREDARGYLPFMFNRQTYLIMHDGQANDDGTITYKGQKYSIRIWFDALPIAEAYQV